MTFLLAMILVVLLLGFRAVRVGLGVAALIVLIIISTAPRHDYVQTEARPGPVVDNVVPKSTPVERSPLPPLRSEEAPTIKPREEEAPPIVPPPRDRKPRPYIQN